IVLMALTFPDADNGFETFTKLKTVLPDVPVVGGARPMEVYELSRFVANGLQHNIQRDDAGNFLFLLLPTLESTYRAAAAERSRKLAERLREEIESVRRLQESVIPRDLPVPPGYEIAARYETSQIKVLGNRPVVMAGGDYYDVFSMGPNELVLLVGDASGHGMKACMSIMTMHTLIRMIREHRYKDTAEFVAEVNNRLCEQQIIRDEGGFITLLYCVLNTETHMLEWTSAGHQMPLLQDLGTNEVHQLGTDEDGGLPLGIAGSVPYDKLTAPIPPNSRVLLYTDGLIEAFPEGKEEHREFGMDGVIRTLKETAMATWIRRTLLWLVLPLLGM
ncbi:MAG TPA: serine/threonine-protein phosphatase, partial [Planctomycetaceae bacterium]|nr:serine/threonine-protein phosphatase [Planctomycetaceae bacterium]